MTPRIACILTAAALLGAAAPADLRGWMQTTIDPASKAFWAAGNEPPDNDTPTAAAARWVAAAPAARTLEETGLALQKAPYTRGPEWDAFAQKQVDSARAGAKAISSKDMESAFVAGGDMYEACNGCHAKFIPGRG